MSTKFLVLITLTTAAVLAMIFFAVFRAKIEKEITVAIVAAAGTVIASVIVVSVTQYNTRQMEVTEAHRLKKIEVYSEFGDLVFSIFGMVKIPNRDDLTAAEKEQLLRDSQSELEKMYSSFSKKLLLWGSPEVIQKWLKFMATARSVEAQASETDRAASGLATLLDMDEVFRSMREDLELSNHGLEEGDLVKAFLTDPESIDKMLGTRR